MLSHCLDRRRIGVWAVSLVCLSLAAGCDRGSRRLSLNQHLARDSFTAFLDAWEEGRKPESLRQGEPEIIVGDYAWNSGYRLLDYELGGEEHNDGTNLHLSATLVLENPQGRQSRQQVTYIVGTDPVITIFRK